MKSTSIFMTFCIAGIVNSNFIPEKPLLENMKQVNDNVFELIMYLDN